MISLKAPHASISIVTCQWSHSRLVKRCVARSYSCCALLSCSPWQSRGERRRSQCRIRHPTMVSNRSRFAGFASGIGSNIGYALGVIGCRDGASLTISNVSAVAISRAAAMNSLWISLSRPGIAGHGWRRLILWTVPVWLMALYLGKLPRSPDSKALPRTTCERVGSWRSLCAQTVTSLRAISPSSPC